MFLLPRAPVSAVGTAFVSCRHICLIIMSHSVIFCFVSQTNLIWFDLIWFCPVKRLCKEQCPVDAGEEDYVGTAWINNMSTWTKLSVEESFRMTNDRDEWRKYVHGVTNPRIRGWLMNRTDFVNAFLLLGQLKCMLLLSQNDFFWNWKE